MEVYPWLRLVVVVGRALFQQKLGSFYFSNASTSSSSSFSFHVLILQQSYVLSLYRGIPHSSNKRSCAISGRWRFSHAISLSLHLLRSFFFFILSGELFRCNQHNARRCGHGRGKRAPVSTRSAKNFVAVDATLFSPPFPHIRSMAWPQLIGTRVSSRIQARSLFFSVFSSFSSSFVFFVSSGLSAISEPTVSPLVHAPNPELFFDRNTKEKNVQKERRGKRQTVQTRKEL